MIRETAVSRPGPAAARWRPPPSPGGGGATPSRIEYRTSSGMRRNPPGEQTGGRKRAPTSATNAAQKRRGTRRHQTTTAAMISAMSAAAATTRAMAWSNVGWSMIPASPETRAVIDVQESAAKLTMSIGRVEEKDPVVGGPQNSHQAAKHRRRDRDHPGGSSSALQARAAAITVPPLRPGRRARWGGRPPRRRGAPRPRGRPADRAAPGRGGCRGRRQPRSGPGCGLR